LKLCAPVMLMPEEFTTIPDILGEI